MTKEEAILKAEQGVKIAHRSFTPEEWVTWKDGLFVDEQGYHLDFMEFFSIRSGGSWETGWKVWSDPKA